LLLGRTTARRADVGSWEHGDLLELAGIKCRLPDSTEPAMTKPVYATWIQARSIEIQKQKKLNCIWKRICQHVIITTRSAKGFLNYLLYARHFLSGEGNRLDPMKKYEPYMEAIYAHEPFMDHGIKRTNRIQNNVHEWI
jgi:hypothetical protein